MIGPDVLDAVRRRTREMHAVLDGHAAWEIAFADVAAYGRLLAAFRSVVVPADLAIAAALGESAPLGYVTSDRRDWLDRDLVAIAPNMKPREVVTDEDWDFVRRSRAAAAGALYVLEGSALGGRELARRLDDRLGLSPETGGRYFHGRGDETATHWKSFVAWFRSRFTTAGEIDVAAEASARTFERFQIALASFDRT